MNTPAHALVNLVLLTGGEGSVRGFGGPGGEAAVRGVGLGVGGVGSGVGDGASHVRVAAAVLVGGVVPDLPMVVFYGWEKLAGGASEAAIWGELYFEPGWQAFFDLFNSLPLLAVGLYVAWRVRSPVAAGLFASMGLHVLADLPLHAEDAHRHFFPLSDWRFESPISYWDPRRFGEVVGSLELAAVAVCCVVAFRRFRSPVVRGLVGLAAAAYAAQWAWAAVVWG